MCLKDQFILADGMILYPKDPNNSTKHLDLINTFSELAEYKIKMDNLKAFLYTNNKFIEKDTRKKILIIIK